NDYSSTVIYTLSLHDALPISLLELQNFLASLCEACPSSLTFIRDLFHDPEDHRRYLHRPAREVRAGSRPLQQLRRRKPGEWRHRSEEHTSELQSREKLVCRLL